MKVTATKASIDAVRVTEIKNPDYKDILVEKNIRKRDKTQAKEPSYTKKKIGNSTAYLL